MKLSRVGLQGGFGGEHSSLHLQQRLLLDDLGSSSSHPSVPQRHKGEMWSLQGAQWSEVPPQPSGGPAVVRKTFHHHGNQHINPSKRCCRSLSGFRPVEDQNKNLATVCSDSVLFILLLDFFFLLFIGNLYLQFCPSPFFSSFTPTDARTRAPSGV